MTDKAPWCCTGHVSECPLCAEYGTRMIDPCPGHPPVDENQQTVDTARLHAERRHPDYEYATTHGPRKQWDESDRPPAGESCDPDYTWSPNVDAGRPGMGWDRFEYHEEAYWRRPKTRSGPQEVDGNMGGAEAPAADLLDDALAAQLGRPLYDAINKRLADGQRAEAANERARALTARWTKAGPPPLGVPLARWWDARLAELNTALDEPQDQT